MNLAREYRNQFDWRDWGTIFEALPLSQGQTVLDLGCGVGDLTAELVARGARVVGIDSDQSLLDEARARQLPNAEFRLSDLSSASDFGLQADGIWCSFTAAYFPEFSEMLETWANNLRPGGWIALTEIDDLFGHEPLGARTRAMFDAFAREALSAGRYDFHMGRKLRNHLERSGFTISKMLTLEDEELSFDGPADGAVVDAWRARFNRMMRLREFCGSEFEHIRDDFLRCLGQADHSTAAKVYAYVATR